MFLIRNKRCFLAALFLFITLTVSAQKKSDNVIIPETQPTISIVIKKIEEQTGMRFAYTSDFDTSKRVDIPKTQTNLSDMLVKMLAGTGFTYRINGDFIIIDKQTTQSKQIVKTQNRVLIGVVQDAHTRKRIEGATVSLNGRTITRTNNLGHFELKNIPEGYNRIGVRFSGYIFEERVEMITLRETERRVYFSLSPDGKSTESKVPEVEPTPLPKIETPFEEPIAPLNQQEEVATEPSPSINIQSNIPIQDLKFPKFAIKTNILYGAATATPNIGIEIGLGKKTTLDLWGAYNPWNLDGSYESNKKKVHILVIPEFRYWLCERFNGHFFGVNTFFAYYNVSGYQVPSLFEKEYRYQGNSVGVGLSYGYHWMWNKKWGMEFTVGAGFALMKYAKYDCPKCGEDLGKFQKTYIGPTKVGISLVYIFK